MSDPSSDDDLVGVLDETWLTVGQVQRIVGAGQARKIAEALDRLWRAGRVDREATELGLGSARRGGGGEILFVRYRRKPHPAKR